MTWFIQTSVACHDCIKYFNNDNENNCNLKENTVSNIAKNNTTRGKTNNTYCFIHAIVKVGFI